jgi:primosomal protein N' (replication factor Y) (superfamily II helicase)
VNILVAVPVPFLPPLTYRVPDDSPLPLRGARVRVPLGTRTVVGCALGTADDAESPADLRAIIETLDAEAFVPPHVVDLALWVAEYYAAGPGEVLSAAMPPARASARGFRTVEVVALTAQGRDIAAAFESAGGATEPLPRLGKAQREALTALAGVPTGLPVPLLKDRGIPADAIQRLVRRGLASKRRERSERDPFEGSPSRGIEGDPNEPRADVRSLTPDQDAAMRQLKALLDTGSFSVTLLHGVTGSGKTELYLQLASHALAAGRRVLILVPEIALTPAVTSLFRAAFGERIAIQHSGLSDGERHDQWHRIRRGEVDVVVGTRSAVFAPIDRVGLIVVDEEHDGSYKQEETPRYNGRDVAIVRGRQAGALVVLGSATPSLETYHNAERGRYQRVVLTRRILDRPMAATRIVNMRDEYADAGPDVILSRPLVEAMQQRVGLGEQAMLLLNRRGFATAVVCRQCGGTLECPNCSVSLTVHTRAHGASRAQCHYCNYSMSVPKACLDCAAPYLEQTGFGTERVEEEIRRLLPGLRVARVDRDTMQRKGAIQSVLGRFAAGEIDVLVGTQMIAKGHDFPRVTLVGVISADVGLGMADFRAAERTFQLLTQVAGRAGRGGLEGEAIIQTLFPEHYSIRLACRQDYLAFYAEEIKYRRAMRYPPAVGLVNVVIRGRTLADAMTAAADLVARLLARDRAAFRVLGPAPAPLGRLRGEYRAQFFLKGVQRRPMRDALVRALEEMPELRRRVTVDVDPLSVL